MVVFLHNHWIMRNTWILSNAVLAGIAWLSLLIKKPFTLQYAREQVAPTRWRHPIFIKINNILTISWAIIFPISTIIHLVNLYYIKLPASLY